MKRRKTRANRRVLQIQKLADRRLLAADPYLFDVDSTGWYTYWGQTSEEWGEIFEQRRGESIPVDIELRDDDYGSQRVSGVWHSNPDDREWAQFRNLTSDGFSEKWKEYADQGYRLIDQETYMRDGQRRYAGIWVENTESLAWASFRNMSRSTYQEKLDEHKDRYMVTDVDAFQDGSTTMYSVIFVEQMPGTSWRVQSNLTGQEFSDLFAEMKDTHRVLDFDSYDTPSGQRYLAVWIEEEQGRLWKERRDMDADGFWNYYHRYRDSGYRVTDIEVYETDNGIRYGAVWRQNNDRPDWHLKDRVQGLVGDFVDNEAVTGLGIAVAHKGE